MGGEGGIMATRTGGQNHQGPQVTGGGATRPTKPTVAYTSSVAVVLWE